MLKADRHAKGISRCFLHKNLAHFSALFSGKFAENCIEFSIFFKLFHDDFFMGLCAGMGTAGSRSNPGVNVAIPIGIALVKIVSAARK